MRRLLLCLLCLGLSFTSICEAETFSPVRLHVVADSNEPEAQRLKLLVRDRVALETRVLLASAHSEAEACAILREKAAYLRACARQAARENGYDGRVAIRQGQMLFPARLYGTLLLPAGAYDAVRVELGAAEGRNWWCVLYPSLCVRGGTDGPIRFYSSVRTWLERIRREGMGL